MLAKPCSPLARRQEAQHDCQLLVKHRERDVHTVTVALRPPAVALTREWSYRLYQRPWGKYALVLTAPRRRIGETSSASPARAQRTPLQDVITRKPPEPLADRPNGERTGSWRAQAAAETPG